MNILITGGAGYIGTELVEELASRPEVRKIIVYDNLSRANYNLFLHHTIVGGEKVNFVQGDLLDSRRLNSLLEGIDVVYHLAAKVTTPFANTDPHIYEQVNNWGTAELVYAVENQSVKQFIYLSSTSVYGASKTEYNEESAVNPRTFYGISKLRGEEHVQRLADRMATYIVRCGNVYGYSRSMRFDAVVNKFAFEANFHNRITIEGDGSQSRAFIHIDQLKNCLAQLTIEEIPSGIYNMVGQNHSVIDLVDALKEIKPELEFLFVNQHLSLRNMHIDLNLKIEEYINVNHQNNLREELKEFMSKFSF